MFRKVLVANRGEIAVRVLRCLRESGIASAAVYSAADRDALHVRMADEAVAVGKAHPRESYLDVEAVIGAAKSCGAGAIHPGYGFLAENGRFAARCAEEGIVFIGPPAESLRLLGDKVEARRLAARLGLPVIPGTDGPLAPGSDARARAAALGYPLLVKASAGGGGRGMRVVSGEGELLAAVEAARREAAGAFGDDAVYLEKRIEGARHVEVQVLGDRKGNFVHLGERECSLQRRNQKLVEESPSPAVGPEKRAAMASDALRLAKAAGCSCAATVEFLLDPAGRHWFLEVNPRIQVEHPVTEELLGVDLVAEQLRIAAGEPLRFRQEDLRPRGHAIECRVMAEDPARDFAPCPGRILAWKEPGGPGVRVDAGVEAGSEVPLEYDAILAKVVATGPDRETARRRMERALGELVVLGVETTAPFLREVVAHEAFRTGRLHTGFFAEHFPSWRKKEGQHCLEALAAAAAHLARDGAPRGAAVPGERAFDPWRDLGKWELGKR
jgi:acetyl-CoA carboxylase biotin carboxylase subunit